MKFITTITALFLFAQSNAQSNFQPGSVQKMSGETIQGWIDYRAWDRNPKSIRFKEQEGGSATTFTIADISAFTVTGKEKYVRAVVSKDMRPVEQKDLTVITGDSVVMDTAFLRLIVEGKKLNLYALRDDKAHFYIKDASGEYQELLYKVYLVAQQNAEYLQTRAIYRDQLKAYLFNDPNRDKLERKLQSAAYKEKDLGVVVTMINGESATPYLAKNRVKPVYFVSGGVTFSTIKISGFEQLEMLNFTNKPTPALGLGVEIVSDRNHGSFAFRLEALYSSLDIKGNRVFIDWKEDEIDRTYLLKMTRFAPVLSAFYSPFRGPSYRVYGGVGLAYNFSSYSKNVLTDINRTDNITEIDEKLLEYENNWMSANVQVGAVIKKHFEVNLSAKVLGAFERYNNASVNVNLYGLRVAYRF